VLSALLTERQKYLGLGVVTVICCLLGIWMVGDYSYFAAASSVACGITVVPWYIRHTRGVISRRDSGWTPEPDYKLLPVLFLAVVAVRLGPAWVAQIGLGAAIPIGLVSVYAYVRFPAWAANDLPGLTEDSQSPQG
jgi:hypothetical protein